MKLTLELDDELVKRAEEWSRERGVPLSEGIARMVREATDFPISPWLAQFIGAARRPGPAPDDAQVLDDYLAYLEEKYR